MFVYDKDKGKLYRKSTNKEVVGTNDRGYLITKIGNKTFKVHRLIWLLENDCLPIQIDHKDGDKTNNQISNLRDVDDTTNQQNRKDVKGYYTTDNGRYRVDLYVGGAKKYIGTFQTEQEAKDAYVAAKIRFYPGYIHTTPTITGTK